MRAKTARKAKAIYLHSVSTTTAHSPIVKENTLCMALLNNSIGRHRSVESGIIFF
jgi:hypothetical protein